jgi:hypothetical protein
MNAVECNTPKNFVEGASLFFCSQSLSGPWHTESLERKKHKISCKDKWVAMACHSMQSMQSQGRGHTAMIYTESTKWSLVVIQQLVDRTKNNNKIKVLQFPTNQDILSNTTSWLNKKEIVFCWVSVRQNHNKKPNTPLLFINPSSERQSEFFESTICPSIHKDFLVRRTRKRKSKRKSSNTKRKKTGAKSMNVATGTTRWWITIYTSNLKKTCLEIWQQERQQEENLFLVPETRPVIDKPTLQFLGNRISIRERNYHAIKKDEVDKINNLPEPVFNKKLNELSKKTISLLQVQSLRSNPIRFVHCPHNEFMKQKERKGSEYLEHEKSKYVFAFSNAPNIDIKGLVMSMWVYDKAEAHFSFEDLQITESAVGAGFGDRRSMKCIGVNVYMGSRLSSRPRKTPLIHSKDLIYRHDFSRKGFQFYEELATIRKKLCESVRQVAGIAKDINPEYHNFIGRNTCSVRNIMTFGTTERMVRFIDQEGRVSFKQKRATGLVNSIGFASSIHRDKCDLITEDQVDELMKNSRSREKWWQGHHTNQQYKTIRSDVTEGSFGLPTTCGHQVVFKSKKQGILTAHFGMLDFALPLDERGVVHHFLGWSFSHLTLVPIQKQHGVVFSNNSTFKEKNWDGAAIVLAWGSTGGSKEATLKAASR